MGRRQASRNLFRIVSCLARGQRAATQALAEGFTLQQFRHNVRRTFVLPEIMNGHDVGVVERRDRLCFLLEAMQTVRIAREIGGQDFDGNVAV